MVTDWNPLTIWIYKEPYIRFPANDFSFQEISDKFAHLCNHSIAKEAQQSETEF
jgi:tubulin monoglycylase TTLL3/8